MTLENTIRNVVKVLQSCKDNAQLSEILPWGVEAIERSATQAPAKPLLKARDGKMLERITPPRIASCRLCGATGLIEGAICRQCNGSGRVIVESEITTYIQPYKPQV